MRRREQRLITVSRDGLIEDGGRFGKGMGLGCLDHCFDDWGIHKSW